MLLGIGLVLCSSAYLALTQSTHTVSLSLPNSEADFSDFISKISVGQFYEPPVTAALEDDVVEFVFFAGYVNPLQIAILHSLEYLQAFMELRNPGVFQTPALSSREASIVGLSEVSWRTTRTLRRDGA